MPDTSRLAALGIRRTALLAELDEVMAEIKQLALEEIASGSPKFYVAKDAAVSRVQIDKWIKAAR